MDEFLTEIELLLEFSQIENEIYNYKKEEFLLLQEKEFKEKKLLEEVYNEY